MALGRTKRALVVGCGSFGAAAAMRLSNDGYSVTIADVDPSAFGALDPEFGGETVAGDGEDISVLEECEVSLACVLLASAGRDAVNYYIARVAAEVYGVERVFARIEDPALIELLDDTTVEPICPHTLCVGELCRQMRLG